MNNSKKLWIAIICLAYVLPGLAQQTYRTSNTMIDDMGKWTKIATVELTSRFRYSNVILELNGGHSSARVGTAKVFFRVKQQEAFPGDPYVQLELLEGNDGPLHPEHFVAIHRSSSGSGSSGSTIVELYVQITRGWEIISFVPTHRFELDAAVFHEHQPFTTSLPAGTQFPAVVINQIAQNGFFGGNVGIGTTSLSAKLTVGGDILAEKVKVVTSVETVPDYVFKKDYDLRSLEEVANYVKTNSHLPEVPSAQEIATDGHDLGEMNLLLLKKIEELTLYMIEQQEEIRELRVDLEKLTKYKR